MPKEADQQEPQGQEPQTQDDGNEPDTDSPPDYKAEAEKWKVMSRKHEAQAKQNADAARRLREMEDAEKTETQKLTDKVTAAEKRAAEAEAKAIRYEVATELGIRPRHMKYLAGSTREDIEESAKGILDDFPETYGKSDTDASQPTRPKERLRSGATPDEEPDETDPRKLAAAVPRL